MNTTDIIGLKLRHATNADITGEIADVLFDMSLKEVGSILADVTTPRGTAPVLISPQVLSLDGGIITATSHADDILARHTASLSRTSVPIDPADLPSTFIGPFGNTFSPSMIAALFNARVDGAKHEVGRDKDGVWTSELLDHAVRAHVADIGHIADISLDDRFTHTNKVVIKTLAGELFESPPEALTVTREPAGQLVITISQDAAV